MSSRPYGYRTRTDPSSRLIPANEPESRVSAPLRMEARPVVHAVKEPPVAEASTPQEDLIQAYVTLIDAQRWIGANISSLSGGSGTETIGWLSDIGLYGRRLVLTSGVGFRCFGLPFQPRFMVDPSQSPRPFIYRIEDLCMATWTPGGGTPRASCYFWIRSGTSSFSSADTNQKGIGFRARAPSAATAVMRWNAYVGDGTNAIVDEDLGVDADQPHMLTMEIDSHEQCIRWYVDDVLAYTWAPASGEVPDLNVAGNTHLYGWEQNVSGSSTEVRFYHWMLPVLPISARDAA